MAVIQESKTVSPTIINKFLGLNLSDTGDTQIALGESGRMDNFYITDDYKLRKMYGYEAFKDFNSSVKGMFSTKIGDIYYLLVASGGYIYCFDGGTLGNDYEVKPEKTSSFAGDGITTIFDLRRENIESIEEVKVNNKKVIVEGGTIPPEEEDEYAEGISYSVDLVNGTIEFSTAPGEEHSIVVNYTKHIGYTVLNEEPISDTDTSFFEFDNKVYILANGYYKWDGATFSEVEGYIPTVFINTPAGNQGGGTIYDEINMLTPKKKQTFNGNGNTHEFKIAQIPDEIISVKVDGVDVAYTSSGDLITITGTAPREGQDVVEICWSKNDNDRSIIEGMKFGTIFGGDVDTRVFLYGNPSCKNRVYFSATSFENDIAVPSVEYFPATAQVDIGPSNFAVTDLTRQYDRLLATTNKPEAYYLTLTTEQLQVTLANGEPATRYVPSVKTLPLNQAHGNFAMGQGQLLMNYPVTFEAGAIMQWKATNVRDEKNVEEISQKIKIDLDNIPISAIKTLDLQEDNQLWIIYDTKVWIYNYINKTYSRLNLKKAVDNITSLNGQVYMSTTNHKLIKFSKNYTTYDGETIDAYWEMNFADFGVPYLRKTMNRCWISMQPQNWSSADVSFVTNRAESMVTKHIEYKKQWFDNVDFNDWSFQSSINPQPFKLKLKAKKFTNLKLTIKNEENSACTILGIVMQVESFGYSK